MQPPPMNKPVFTGAVESNKLTKTKFIKRENALKSIMYDDEESYE